MTMNLFEEASLRLKQQLRITQDKQAAAALSITEAAWKMRKKRGDFPIKEVFALASQRPELGLDPDWIVTGHSAYLTTKTKAETGLIQAFRVMNSHERAEVLNWMYERSGILKMSKEEMERRWAIYEEEMK